MINDVVKEISMRFAASVVWILLVSSSLPAKVFDKNTEIAGLRLHYKILLPRDYDAAKTYPAILAFPPGSQTMDMVLTTLNRNWAPEGDRRGYIVVVPATPLPGGFLGQSSKVFPEFIEHLLREYKIRDGKFHIAGMSNGGRTAFHIASTYPQYFWSVTGFPGYLPEATPERVAALAKMCIYMHVGEFDGGWVEPMQQQAAAFREKGYTVRFTIEKNEGHVMSSLNGAGAARLFNQIEEARQGCAQ
jgi:predicted peptidase